MNVVSNLELSANLQQSYWLGLRREALRRTSYLGDTEELPLKSQIWPFIIYQASFNPMSFDLHSKLHLENHSFTGLICQSLAYLEKLPETIASLSPVPSALEDSSLSLFTQMVSSALSLIKSIAPPIYADVIAGIRGFVPITSVNFSNFSDPKYFGLIFINYDKIIDVYGLAEDIVHETAHHALFAYTAIDPCLKEPGRLLYSPLRGYSRPTIGVLHSAMALGRILLWVNKLRNGGQTNHMDYARMAETKYHPLFVDTIQILSKATLTSKGRDLLEALEVLCYLNQ